MRRIAFVLATLAPVALAAPVFTGMNPDVTAPIRQFLDGFNAGDSAKANASYAAGEVDIIDELLPHRWSGKGAGLRWADDYRKQSAINRITEASVRYAAPIREDIDADLAYVVVPCVYLYKDHGKHMAEEAQMTFVLHQESGGWKIRAWTWNGTKPHGAK